MNHTIVSWDSPTFSNVCQSRTTIKVGPGARKKIRLRLHRRFKNLKKTKLKSRTTFILFLLFPLFLSFFLLLASWAETMNTTIFSKVIENSSRTERLPTLLLDTSLILICDDFYHLCKVVLIGDSGTGKKLAWPTRHDDLTMLFYHL